MLSKYLLAKWIEAKVKGEKDMNKAQEEVVKLYNKWQAKAEDSFIAMEEYQEAFNSLKPEEKTKELAENTE